MFGYFGASLQEGDIRLHQKNFSRTVIRASVLALVLLVSTHLFALLLKRLVTGVAAPAATRRLGVRLRGDVSAKVKSWDKDPKLDADDRLGSPTTCIR
jgi:hypothetical protein